MPVAKRNSERTKEAFEFFQAQPPGYKRIASFWVMSAKKEETRLRRPHRAGPQSGQNWTADTQPGNGATVSDHIILVSPLTAAAYINRGLARFHTGDLDGALSDCDQALAINPRLVQAYRNRGAIRWTKKDLDGHC